MVVFKLFYNTTILERSLETQVANLTGNWHFTDLPLSTPNSMFIFIHHRETIYLNTFFFLGGGEGGSENWVSS